MRAEAIFRPMSVLALWTFAVLVGTGVRRLLAARARRLSVQAFHLGQSPALAPEVEVFNRNLMNLLEMPVLFYVVSLGLYVTHAVEGTALSLAWTVVVLRLVHSLIHLTFNRVTARFAVFAASN